MKKIFSIFLACCATFAFADEGPVFEESDEAVKAQSYTSFCPDTPIFGDDIGDCDDGRCPAREINDLEEVTPIDQMVSTFLQIQADKPKFEETEQDHKKFRLSFGSWPRYKANFGMEKLFVRFPQKPAISQSSSLFTAYAYDQAVLYSITGFFPPVGNIYPNSWFDELLRAVDCYPYALITRSVYQVENGDWILDYVTHDYVQNLVIKGRAIVTPFNAYTLQCVKPNGVRDYFEYFIDNFMIKCECDQ